MKILLVCNKPPYPPRDGGSLATFNLAQALAQSGHLITIITIYTDKHKLSEELKSAFAGSISQHAVYVDTTPRWTDALLNLIFSHKPYNASRFISKSFENKLVSILKAEKQDVVQLEGLYLTPYIPAIRKHSDALVALRAHNVEHELWKRIANTEKNLIRKLYFTILARRIKRFESEILNQYDLLLPITKRDLKQFHTIGNIRPFLVCPAGIDIDDEANTPVKSTRSASKDDANEHFSLFFLGSLDWIPNQEGLLWFITEVFPALTINHPELKLKVAGRNAPSRFVNKISMPGVEYFGEIVDSREFMKANTVMVAPCFSGGGMRVKIIEAMALAIPVATTPIGAEGLMAKHDENIIIADNAGEFVRHLERLMKYPDLCHRIGKNARNLVSGKFNNRKIANSLAYFYNVYLK